MPRIAQDNGKAVLPTFHRLVVEVRHDATNPDGFSLGDDDLHSASLRHDRGWASRLSNIET